LWNLACAGRTHIVVLSEAPLDTLVAVTPKEITTLFAAYVVPNPRVAGAEMSSISSADVRKGAASVGGSISAGTSTNHTKGLGMTSSSSIVVRRSPTSWVGRSCG